MKTRKKPILIISTIVRSAQFMIPRIIMLSWRIFPGMFAKIEKVFCGGFKRAQQAGELDNKSDPHILAKLLLINIQGLRVYSNMTTDKETLNTIAEPLLICLNLGATPLSARRTYLH